MAVSLIENLLTRLRLIEALGLRKVGSGTAPPLVTDDSAAGYSVGSLYLATNKMQLFVAASVAVGAAVWVRPGRRAFLEPNAGTYVATAMESGSAATPVAMVSDRLTLFPFTPKATFIAARTLINVTTGAASAEAKVVCYSSTATGRPSALLFETGALSCTAAAKVEETVSRTFNADTTYWIGTKITGTPTLSCWPADKVPHVNGRASGTVELASTSLQQTLTYASATPNPYSFGTDVSATLPPAVWFRI